jgi:putative component of membrane protein insertase Oxa1/YidC/SpoIIIJ protein YidD
MLRAGSIAVIELYQGRLSPLKGFSCAHRVLHGGASCSQAVKLAIAEGGLAAGWRAVKTRARDCRAAMIALQSGTEEGERGIKPNGTEPLPGEVQGETPGGATAGERAVVMAVGIIALGAAGKCCLGPMVGGWLRD